jgi:hypothetical protein
LIGSTFAAVRQRLTNTGGGAALAVGERPEEVSLCADGFLEQLVADRLLALVLTPTNSFDFFIFLAQQKKSNSDFDLYLRRGSD